MVVAGLDKLGGNSESVANRGEIIGILLRWPRVRPRHADGVVVQRGSQHRTLFQHTCAAVDGWHGRMGTYTTNPAESRLGGKSVGGGCSRAWPRSPVYTTDGGILARQAEARGRAGCCLGPFLVDGIARRGQPVPSGRSTWLRTPKSWVRALAAMLGGGMPQSGWTEAKDWVAGCRLEEAHGRSRMGHFPSRRPTWVAH